MAIVFQQQFPFGDSSAGQVEIVERLEPFVPYAWEAMYESWEGHRELVAAGVPMHLHMPPHALAHVIHEEIARRMKNKDREVPHVQVQARRNGTKRMHAMVVDEDPGRLPIAVHFKKLDPEQHLRSNYPTPNQRKVWQPRRELDRAIHRVIFGWITENEGATVRAVLTHPAGDKENSWVHPVPDQAAVIAARKEREDARRAAARRSEKQGFEIIVKDGDREQRQAG